MTADPAVRARDRAAPVLPPVVTVITDLITTHLSWRDAAVDRVVVPSAPVAPRAARRTARRTGRYLPIGLPVAAEFCQPPLGRPSGRSCKRELGPAGRRFLVVLTGGAEGSGGLRRPGRRDLAAGRRRGRRGHLRPEPSAQPRVARLAGRSGGGRLTAHGFVGNMADWLRCADVVVGKAGPARSPRPTCCGAPLVLTSYVPGQEKGNAGFVTGAGAGRLRAAATGPGRGDRLAAPQSGRARRHARRVGRPVPPGRGRRHRGAPPASPAPAAYCPRAASRPPAGGRPCLPAPASASQPLAGA